MGRCSVRWLAVVAAAAALAASAPAFGQGVAADSITLGVTSAFKGHAASLGSELYRGYMALFARVNDAGGVKGRRILVKAYDDGYDPPSAVRNTIDLVERDRVFLLFGNVGTPTTVKVLPLLSKYRSLPMVLFSPFTGAQAHREGENIPLVVNVRASYRAETAALVDLFAGMGRRRIGVFFQNDAYGVSGKDGVLRALKDKGLSLCAETTYERGAAFAADMSAQVRALAGCDAVVAVGTYQACAAFVRDARRGGFAGPIANISFVGSQALLSLLLEQGRKDGRSYADDLYNSEVVPLPEDSLAPLVAQYRQDMDRYAVAVPPDLKDPAYVPSRYSFGSLEGYLNAAVLVRALEKAAEPLSGETFLRAMESLGKVDIGLGVPLEYGPDDHQGLDAVYVNRAQGGRWVAAR